MHPELAVWVEMYLLSTAYENQEYQLYKDAGAGGIDFEVFAMLKAKHRAWLDAKTKADKMA